MKTPRITLAFCSLAHAYTHAVELSFPVLLLFIKEDFNATGYSMLALIYAGSLLLFGVGAIPFGALADKKGGIPVILVGVGLSVTGAVMATLSQSLLLLGAAMLLMGFGISTYHPSGLAAISHAYPKGKGRSHAMGLHGFGGSFGQFLAPILAGIGAVWLGWRWVYGGLLAFGLALGLLGFVVWRLLESKAGTGKTQIETSENRLEKRVKNGRPKSSSYFAVLKNLWSMSIAFVVALTIFRGLFYRGVSAFTPALANEVWGLSKESGGLMLTILLLTGSVGHLVGGWSHGRYGARRPLIVYALLSLLGLILLLLPNSQPIFGISMATLNIELPLGPGLLGLVIFGFAFFGGQPVVNAHIADIAPSSARGFFFGFTFATRFGLASVATAIVGVAADLWSIKTALAIMALPIILALVTAWKLDEPESRAHGKAD